MSLIQHHVAEHDQNPNMPAAAEAIRLVIWDLDDTFWQGTLSETPISLIDQNVTLIRTLAQRGIMSSVCSKNHFDQAKAMLVEAGVWDNIIFPQIAFAPKGAMIEAIVAAAQLRPASVLFIDDNPVNLNEAVHYLPTLQVAHADCLPTLADDPRLQGKPDPDLSRLKHYKVLEQKQADLSAARHDNLDFLVKSKIRISFHVDVMENFERIHDLVNRTNQLNFTKNRWPEDPAAAKQAYLAEVAAAFHNESGYIKVADRYGSYGICGFYLIHRQSAQHFLFSCRAMNMGVEQYVWRSLSSPKVPIVGEVVSDLTADVHWIDLVTDADDEIDAESPLHTRSIVMRGACDLEIMGHFLRNYGTIKREFPFPYKGWGIFSSARVAAAAITSAPSEIDTLTANLPGLPPDRFATAITHPESDCYILSFSQEIFATLYRSRATGITLPMKLDGFAHRDLTTISYDEVVAAGRQQAASEETWSFLGSDLQYVGNFDALLFYRDLETIFQKLDGCLVILIMLNSTVGQNKGLLKRFAMLNRIVGDAVAAWNNASDSKIHIVRTDDVIRDEFDLTEDRGGQHYVREVYRKLADQVGAILVNHSLRG